MSSKEPGSISSERFCPTMFSIIPAAFESLVYVNGRFNDLKIENEKTRRLYVGNLNHKALFIGFPLICHNSYSQFWCCNVDSGATYCCGSNILFVCFFIHTKTSNLKEVISGKTIPSCCLFPCVVFSYFSWMFYLRCRFLVQLSEPGLTALICLKLVLLLN